MYFAERGPTTSSSTLKSVQNKLQNVSKKADALIDADEIQAVEAYVHRANGSIAGNDGLFHQRGKHDVNIRQPEGDVFEVDYLLVGWSKRLACVLWKEKDEEEEEKGKEEEGKGSFLEKIEGGDGLRTQSGIDVKAEGHCQEEEDEEEEEEEEEEEKEKEEEEEEEEEEKED
uniref:Uncharacterized protein n=1 Tax=Chromera velia CCMP2878 TaxID=1169474 RepID=A0A0K6S6X9_9ALVE|eukprot:Cvel_17732.t2-p1 / transcript=Cvel_17732.t2 / gene=Cvel_17732 / organism=Chromera_velia_CCMP2878 / gene_product=hypothetical protein / transcript_product=hypothetical protein / location=Cvel_scaffold1432:38422-43578(-) / protein_length=171 / sequence_SO=supercontig / SO=protein_coding / is_pseudo=false